MTTAKLFILWPFLCDLRSVQCGGIYVQFSVVRFTFGSVWCDLSPFYVKGGVSLPSSQLQSEEC